MGIIDRIKNGLKSKKKEEGKKHSKASRNPTWTKEEEEYYQSHVKPHIDSKNKTNKTKAEKTVEKVNGKGKSADKKVVKKPAPRPQRPQRAAKKAGRWDHMGAIHDDLNRMMGDMDSFGGNGGVNDFNMNTFDPYKM